MNRFMNKFFVSVFFLSFGFIFGQEDGTFPNLVPVPGEMGCYYNPNCANLLSAILDPKSDINMGPDFLKNCADFYRGYKLYYNKKKPGDFILFFCKEPDFPAFRFSKENGIKLRILAGTGPFFEKFVIKSPFYLNFKIFSNLDELFKKNSGQRRSFTGYAVIDLASVEMPPSLQFIGTQDFFGKLFDLYSEDSNLDLRFLGIKYNLTKNSLSSKNCFSLFDEAINAIKTATVSGGKVNLFYNFLINAIKAAIFPGEKIDFKALLQKGGQIDLETLLQKFEESECDLEGILKPRILSFSQIGPSFEECIFSCLGGTCYCLADDGKLALFEKENFFELFITLGEDELIEMELALKIGNDFIEFDIDSGAFYRLFRDSQGRYPRKCLIEVCDAVGGSPDGGCRKEFPENRYGPLEFLEGPLPAFLELDKDTLCPKIDDDEDMNHKTNL